MTKAIKVTEKELEKVVNKETLENNGVKPKSNKITIMGNALVLTSKLKFETIQKMEKYNRDALCLIEADSEEHNEIFRIGTGKLSSISKYGVTFAEANSNGYAVATVLFPEGVTNKREYIKDNFATALFMLTDLEDAVEKSCAELEKAYADLDNDIVEVE